MGGIVIIGGGEAGGRAALALRGKGHDGPITLIGAESVPPYERPPLSKAVLTGDADGPPVVSSAEACEAKAIDLRLGQTVTGIDRPDKVLTLADGATLAYEKLLLATGARARPLALPGGEAALLLRTVDDAAAIRSRLGAGARLAVIGGGFIGLEVAASASVLGAEVTVIELAPRLMGRAVPAALAGIMAERHAKAGIRLMTECGVERIEGGDVVLASGERIEADVIVAGIGAVPDTALAEAAGLEIENGIRVDAALRTSDPAIFACGDCCSFPHPLSDGRRIRLESWRNACDQAAAAAGSLLGEDTVYAAVPWFWSDQHDLGLQIAGLPDQAADVVIRDLGGKGEIHVGLAEGGRIVSASGVGPGNAVAKDIRLLEMLIAKRAAPERSTLGDASVNLKKLLRG